MPRTSLVWPSNCGSTSRTVSTAVIPARMSSLSGRSEPVFSLRAFASTTLRNVFTSACSKPARWVPPLVVAITLTNVRTSVSYPVPHRIATSTVHSRSSSREESCPVASSTGTVSLNSPVPCRRHTSVTGGSVARWSTNSAMPPSWRMSSARGSPRSSAVLHRVQDGPQALSLGFPMASDRRTARRSAAVTTGRTTARCAAALPGGDHLGPHQRRPLARFTRAVSQSCNVLAAAPRMVGRRPLPRRLGEAARQTRSAQGHQLGRGDRRRLVCTGKKGGADVGYGRKGKGTTVMLMVDGEGTPLSAFVTDAATSEVQSIESLVDERMTSPQAEASAVRQGGGCRLAAGVAADCAGSCCSARTARTAPKRPPTMAASCGATSAGTKWSVRSAGCTTSAG